MTKEELVLAVLSTSDGDPWVSSQLLKVFFLLDRKIPEETGGPHWNFQPFDYGPYDVTVFRTLDTLVMKGLVLTQRDGYLIQSYRSSVKGHRQGEEELKKLPERAQDYIQKLSEWIRALSFVQSVAAIRKDFPEMVTWGRSAPC